ncbi:esterase/lipase family protein [Streptomyces sp. NPDC058686]|uniref:esterase/lipase family protein n=1 Tax=Streptomyces sp. NPDC058686 TaxID=3346599 RepID=UPI003651DB19
MKSHRRRGTYVLGAAASAAHDGAASLATSTPAASATEHPGAPKPPVVLVHGGFADASNWNGAIKKLHKDGYPVIAPADPPRGLPTDAPYIAGVLKSVKGPIVLVAATATAAP